MARGNDERHNPNRKVDKQRLRFFMPTHGVELNQTGQDVPEDTDPTPPHGTPRGNMNIMGHLMDFDDGNVTDENVHDIADAIRTSGMHMSAGRYGRFLDWYDNEYGRDDD